MKYLKEIKKFIGESVRYDEYGGGYIWGTDKNNGDQMIAQVEELPLNGDNIEDAPLVSIRGWGAIQHLFKSYEEAEAFQDELGIFIQDAINEKLKTI
jgi:inorganic pyrophosphatase